MTSINKILDAWNNAKNEYLFKMFGGENLILSRPYSYSMQAEAISLEIEKNMNSPKNPYRLFKNWFDGEVVHNAYCDITITNMQGKDWSELQHYYYYSKWHPFHNCLTAYALAANAYLGDDCIVNFPKSGKSMKVFKGMKPMKILHRLIQEFNGDEELFEAFRTWHSMQLNQKHMDGELCLSIHPLDYMTMSDNDNDWKSCMRWTDDGRCDTHGDYRSGTVQCMNSPAIIVAYLHNPEHKFYPIDSTCGWNSKQWRELFIVHEGIINEIKGYPFQDESLTNTCLMWIKELAAKNLGWTYENEEIDVGKTIIDTSDKKVYLTFDSGDYMYKDIGSIGKHRGRINKEKLFNIDKYITQESKTINNVLNVFITIPYGGYATCMSCGCELNGEQSERVMCDNCDTVMICSCCGEPIYEDCSTYWIDDRDEPVCETCFYDECARDSFSDDEYHLMQNMEEIWLLLGYDKNNKPIFYDNIAYAYEPDNEYSNFRSVFPNGYKEYAHIRKYVTPSDVDKSYMTSMYDAFDIYPRDLDKFYSNIVLDDDIYYDYNHNLLIEEDE